MGRRHTAEDYQRIVEEIGWVRGAHEEEDSIQLMKDEPTDGYQQDALDQWIMWVSDFANRPLKGSSLLPH